MSLIQVKSVIEKFVQNDTNDLLTIKGSWGVGKTFFWQSIVEEVSSRAKIGHKNYSYISLFGINSIETLKNSIIANQIKSIAIGKDRYTSASYITSQIKNIAKYVESNPKIRAYTEGWASELAFQIVNDSLICFDDLERKSDNFDIKDILGLASFLKEQRNCKIVFILNDGTLSEEDKEKFSRHNEKVVDVEVNFAPLANEVFDYVFNKSDPHFETIKFCCLTLEIKNIRILQRIKRFIDDLLPHLKNTEQIVATSVVSSLILFISSYYDKDTGTLSLEFLADFSSVKLYIQKDIRKENVSKDDEKRYELLSKYKYDVTDELDRQLMLFVKKGFLNESFFNELSLKNKQAIAQRGKDSYSEAWKLYKSSFDIEEEVFIEKLVSGFHENVEFLTITDLYNTIDILKRFEKDELANSLADEYVPKMIDYKTLVEMKQFRHFSDYKDEYFLEKLNQIPKPLVEYSFAEAVKKLASNNYFYGEEASFLASAEVGEFYNFFKNEKSEMFYYLGKFLLRFEEQPNASEEQLAIFNKTKESLKRIAQEKEINRLRIFDWFKIEID